ncbi:hypothetical protein GCM10010492_37150 [Saccharothrix mutabilis subsp. mutabilis]|uniref:Uncharacterized protein n=1 Tax=Saccharothrix mutabilis subsp. mutabilis TaxID=66855 RepID=A0ABP3DNC4_9PSEU
MPTPPGPALSNREIALLRATADHRVELTCSSEPDLRVDNLPFCDHPSARALVHGGLIEPTATGPVGTWVPARLTPAGARALGLVAA